jgi:hypothetical protein
MNRFIGVSSMSTTEAAVVRLGVRRGERNMRASTSAPGDVSWVGNKEGEPKDPDAALLVATGVFGESLCVGVNPGEPRDVGGELSELADTWLCGKGNFARVAAVPRVVVAANGFFVATSSYRGLVVTASSSVWREVGKSSQHWRAYSYGREVEKQKRTNPKEAPRARSFSNTFRWAKSDATRHSMADRYPTGTMPADNTYSVASSEFICLSVPDPLRSQTHPVWRPTLTL